MPRQYNFSFEVIAHDPDERPDLDRVEEMINLSMQELVFDEEFAAALGEKQAITIRVQSLGEVPIQKVPQNGN